MSDPTPRDESTDPDYWAEADWPAPARGGNALGLALVLALGVFALVLSIIVLS